MIRTLKCTICVALLMGGVLPCWAPADVIVAEDFFYNQPTRDIETLGGFTLQDYAGGQNGPAGQWTGLWVGNGQTAITGPDFVEEENQYLGIVGDLGVPVNFNYLGRGYQLNGLADDQPIYFATQMRIGAEDVNSMPRMWIHAPLNEEFQIAIGYGPDTGLMGQLGFMTDGTFGDFLDDGEFHLLVGKLEINADGDDEILTVWLDPTGPEEADESLQIEGDVLTSVNDLDGTLRLGRMDPACCANRRIYWDDVAMGTTWDDVVQVNVPRLKLQVNSASGAATLVNDTGTDFDVTYYEILSADGALNVDGWNSLDDQNTSNGGWMENSPTSEQLIESYFGGSTPLESGQSWSLGTPFAAGGAEDLVARVGTAQGLLTLAMVEYVTGFRGDFNGNGEIDLGDIDLLTAASASGNDPQEYDLTGDGLVNVDDVNEWAKAKDIGYTWIGDANFDGQFNTGDFVQVLGIGKYEQPGATAVWSEGDWNGDGVFGTGDLVAALSDGGYEIGPRTDVAAVPEPSAIVLSLLGLAGLLGLTRRR